LLDEVLGAQSLDLAGWQALGRCNDVMFWCRLIVSDEKVVFIFVVLFTWRAGTAGGSVDGKTQTLNSPDVCAFVSFPQCHWTKMSSTNPLKLFNAEMKRRTRVVGIFPNEAVALRHIAAVSVETHDEWAVSSRLGATSPRNPWHSS